MEQTFNNRDSVTALLNCKEVAQILGIKPKTVNKLVRDGQLACVQVTPKERRFSQAQVQEYIEAKTVERIVDKKNRKPLNFLQKGGDKQIGVSGTNLRKEMRSW
jgi:excisionase family DNA binding protein